MKKGVDFRPAFVNMSTAATMDTGGNTPDEPAILVMRITIIKAKIAMQNSEYGEISAKMGKGSGNDKRRSKRTTGALNTYEKELDKPK